MLGARDVRYGSRNETNGILDMLRNVEGNILCNNAYCVSHQEFGCTRF